MARRKNMINIDFSVFADYAEKLDRLNANIKEVIGGAMEKAGREVQRDTRAALSDANLPAHGKYSRGNTEKSIVEPKVDWSGSRGELPLGFDKSKPGAGGFLITGTPKMQPDRKLQDIYGSKSYEAKIRREIRKDLQAEIDKRMGG